MLRVAAELQPALLGDRDDAAVLTRVAALGAAAILLGCAAAHTVEPDSSRLDAGYPGPRELDPDRRLDALTRDEVGILCQWSATQYPSTPTFSCYDAGPLAGVFSVEGCLAAGAFDGRPCPQTVRAFAQCQAIRYSLICMPGGIDAGVAVDNACTRTCENP